MGGERFENDVSCTHLPFRLPPLFPIRPSRPPHALPPPPLHALPSPPPPCPAQKELRERLQIVRSVLEDGGRFRGVNRKVCAGGMREVGGGDAGKGSVPCVPRQ